MKKRIIALALGVILVFSTLGSLSFAAKNVSDFESANNVLRQFGFMSDKSAEQTSPLSRGEFCNAVLKIMNISASGASAWFSDIDLSHDYYLIMSAAQGAGIINSEQARPDDAVTYNEAVKMLVCMLGYENYALQLGGWPTGYIQVASSIGLLGDVRVYDANIISRDAVCLIFNALFCDVMEITAVGDGVTYEIKKGKSVLDLYHGIKTTEGIVEGVRSKRLYANDDIDYGKVKIDGYTYNCTASNIADYVGMNLKFFYDTDTDEIMAFYSDDGNVITFSIEDIVDFENRKFSYENESGNERTAKISADAILLYNNFPADFFDSSLFAEKDGEITLTDSDSDGIFDCVFVDVTEDIVVKSVDGTAEIIYDLYTPGKYVSVKEDSDRNVRFEDKYGNRMYVGELLQYDVISVKTSLDGKNVEAIYSGNEIYGTVEAVEKSNDTLYITIEGKRYSTTDSFMENEEVQTGETAIFAMGTSGKIATVNRAFSKSGNIKIGYLIDAVNGSGLDAQYRYKILASDGQIFVAKSAERLRLDGKTYKKADAYAKLSESGEVVSRPVRYGLDEAGDLKILDTAVKGEDESADSMSLMYSCYADKTGNTRPTTQKLEYRSGTMVFGSKIAINSSTVIFVVPETKTGDDDDYDVFKSSYFVSSDDYSFEAYKTVDASLVADTLVIKNTGAEAKIDNNIAISVFVSMSRILNEKGDALTKMSIMTRNGLADYYVEDPAIISKVKELDDITATHTLANGDVIRFSYTEKNKMITDIELVYDVTSDIFKYPDTFCNTNVANAIYRVSLGEVYAMHGGYILTTLGSIEPGSVLDHEELECYPLSRCTIMVYDSSVHGDNKVSVGRSTDIIDYQTAGKGSKIVLFTRYTDNAIIVLYK